MAPAPVTHTTAQTTAPTPPASPTPIAFYCALWIPVFAVVTWVMMRLMGPRPLVPGPPSLEPEEDEAPGEDDEAGEE